jgi:hypothetical protein
MFNNIEACDTGILLRQRAVERQVPDLLQVLL